MISGKGDIMHYIRITKENSVLKKDWFFIGVQSAESVLLNIFLLRMPGCPLMQTDIYTLTAYGFPVP